MSGATRPSALSDDAVDEAVTAIADATARLLERLPPRRQPPLTLPPLRRLAAASASG